MIQFFAFIATVCVKNILQQNEPRLVAKSFEIWHHVNGKRISKNVYAKTREECEEKLAELIKTIKAEIAAENKKAKQA